MKTLLIIQKKLTKLGNQDPYFSITAEEWETKEDGTKKGRDCISGGCLHEEIERRHKGKYTDLIALHLSKIDGTPMYAVENGFYHYTNGNYDAVKSLLRITDEQFLKLKSYLDKSENKKLTFTEFVNAQKTRWATEANAAILRHDLKIGK